MLRPARMTAVLIVILVALATVSFHASGCSSEDESTTSSEAAATTSESTATSAEAPTTVGSSEPQRLIVGGKTVEEYEAALPDLQQAVEAAPNDLAALQELAIAQFNTGRYEEAASTYQKMLELKDDAFTRNNYGNVLRDWKKVDEAKAEYEKAISADPTLATAYVNLASVLVSEGNVSEAVAVLDRGLAAITGEDRAPLESFKERLTSSTTTT